jgi:hypothetical protein
MMDVLSPEMLSLLYTAAQKTIIYMVTTVRTYNPTLTRIFGMTAFIVKF